MKLLLVDDHKLFLDGLAQVLSLQIVDVDIVKASDVATAIRIIHAQQDIDLALVDLAMPGSSGLDFIQQSTESNSLIPIAVLSASDDIPQIQQVLDMEAMGFIPKTYDAKQLHNAINVILAGNIYLPEHIYTALNDTSILAQSLVTIAQQYEITSRQLEVLALMAEGLSNSQIAATLFISGHTVKSHVKLLFQKLNVQNRIECINQAKKINLLTLK